MACGIAGLMRNRTATGLLRNVWARIGRPESEWRLPRALRAVRDPRALRSRVRFRQPDQFGSCVYNPACNNPIELAHQDDARRERHRDFPASTLCAGTLVVSAKGSAF